MFESLSALSVRAAAEELTRRGVPAPSGWAVALEATVLSFCAPRSDGSLAIAGCRAKRRMADG